MDRIACTVMGYWICIIYKLVNKLAYENQLFFCFLGPMSLAALADPGPDPALLARFTAPAGAPKAVRQRADFFVFFAGTVFAQLEKYRPALAPAYHRAAGRPAWEPVRLLGALVLQFVERLPDRQAAEAMQYDLRWRLALHLQPGESACDPSLLTVFRNRLLAGGQERLGFEAVLALLVAEGWMPKRATPRLDSTHVCGLLARMNRLDCARETIRLALEAVEICGLLPDGMDTAVGALRGEQGRCAQHRRDARSQSARGRRGQAADFDVGGTTG